MVNLISYQIEFQIEHLRWMTLIKLYLTVNFAVPLKPLHDCTAVNSFSVLQQFTVNTSEHNSVCTVRALEHHTVRKLYRSAKIKWANKAIKYDHKFAAACRSSKRRHSARCSVLHHCWAMNTRQYYS